MAKGKGATLSYETTPGGASYTALAATKKIAGPGITTGVVDATTLDSAWKEKEAGLPDAGQLTFEQKYVKTTCDALEALLGVTRLWKVTFNDASTWVCSGFLKDLTQPDLENETFHTISCVVELTGAPTFTAGV